MTDNTANESVVLPQINRGLFQKVYEQISEHPETHDQASWEWRGRDAGNTACGTTRCVAGWAIRFAVGHEDKPLSAAAAEIAVDSDRYSEPECTCLSCSTDRDTVREQGYDIDYERMGARLLGLTPEEASWLFQIASNDEAVELCRKYAGRGRV